MEDRFNNRLGLSTPSKPPDIHILVTIDKNQPQDHIDGQKHTSVAEDASTTSSQRDIWAHK